LLLLTSVILATFVIYLLNILTERHHTLVADKRMLFGTILRCCPYIILIHFDGNTRLIWTCQWVVGSEHCFFHRCVFVISVTCTRL